MWDAQEAADREEAEKAELEAKEQAKENKEKYRTIKAQTWPFFCLKLAQQYIVSRKGRVVVILCVPFPCTTTTTTTIEQSNCECCTIQMDCLYLTNFYHK